MIALTGEEVVEILKVDFPQLEEHPEYVTTPHWVASEDKKALIGIGNIVGTGAEIHIWVSPELRHSPKLRRYLYLFWEVVDALKASGITMLVAALPPYFRHVEHIAHTMGFVTTGEFDGYLTLVKEI